MHFLVYQDRVNQWRWRLVAANNKIIANSAEGYWTKADCLGGISLVKQSYNAPVYSS